MFAELFRAFAARSATRIFWSVGAFTEPAAAGRRAGVRAGAGGHHRWSWSQSFFGIGSLSLPEWTLAVAVGLAPVTVIEILKLAEEGVMKRLASAWIVLWLLTGSPQRPDVTGAQCGPLWTDASGRPSRDAHDALALLGGAAADGLDPFDYAAAALAVDRRRVSTPAPRPGPATPPRSTRV